MHLRSELIVRSLRFEQQVLYARTKILADQLENEVNEHRRLLLV